MQIGAKNEIAGGASIVGLDEPVLVTGATGYLGPAMVEALLRHGFTNIRAFTRVSSTTARLMEVVNKYRGKANVEIIKGNLLSLEDCRAAADGVAVIFHLAIGADKSYADSIMNSVVTTRNLLDASLRFTRLKRFVNVSSFAVYTNRENRRMDETSEVGVEGGDAYAFSKVRQDELVQEYGKRDKVPYVIVRPGSVFGPGKVAITGRVGIDTFGFFIHTGGSNRIPFTYIDNCADAILLAGVRPGVEGEIFNVVDDDLPTSRQFLRMYKRKVKRFRSVFLPRTVSYLLCRAWEKYCSWSEGQLPPAFNKRRWQSEWKKTRYSNEKLKTKLGWRPKVSMQDALKRFFDGCQEQQHA
jgi:nucleoside-diphosphate-sugar epimerase